MSKGYIPERVVYVFPQCKEKEETIDCFPVEYGKSTDAAMNWAKRKMQRVKYDRETKKYVADNIPGSVEKKITKNPPMEGLRIKDLDVRGNGGRAYRVIDKQGFVFDLREDMLMETIESHGIAKGGYLCGSFVWGKVGSQMKLVLVGSSLHSELKAHNKVRNLKKLSSKDLKIGGLYKTAGGKLTMFCGWVNGLEFEVKRHYGTQTDRWLRVPLNAIEIKETEGFSRRMLWYSGRNKEADPQKWKEKIENDLEKNQTFSFEIKRSHSCVGLIGLAKLPDNLVAAIRAVSCFNIEKGIREQKEYNQRYNRSLRPLDEKLGMADRYVSWYGRAPYIYEGDQKPTLPPGLVELINQGLIKE